MEIQNSSDIDSGITLGSGAFFFDLEGKVSSKLEGKDIFTNV